MDVEAARDGLWEIDEDAFEGFGPETNNNKGDLAIEAPRKGANVLNIQIASACYTIRANVNKGGLHFRSETE